VRHHVLVRLLLVLRHMSTHVGVARYSSSPVGCMNPLILTSPSCLLSMGKGSVILPHTIVAQQQNALQGRLAAPF
jgi:hypothetical protein